MSIPPPPGPEGPRHPGHPGQPQPPYPHAPYQYWGQAHAPFARPAPVNGVAIAALVLGLLCFLPAVGLVLGIIALAQIRKRGERGKGMAIAGAVLSTLGLTLWVVSLSTSAASDFWAGVKDGLQENTSLSLSKGDCFDTPDGTFDDDVYDVDDVPCSGAHDAEVFATITLDGDDFPGDKYVSDKADDRCWALQTDYAMDSWTLTSEVDVYYLVPTEDSWSWGDREITCVFGNSDEHSTLTGSLRTDATNLDADQLAFLKAMNAVDDVLYEAPDSDPEEDLPANRAWAEKVARVTSVQAAALAEHNWPSGSRQPAADLVRDMRTALGEWMKAVDSTDSDTFYSHYDKAYGYVDGDTTVTARKALGLATTPPSYEDYPSDGGGSSAGGLGV